MAPSRKTKRILQWSIFRLFKRPEQRLVPGKSLPRRSLCDYLCSLFGFSPSRPKGGRLVMKYPG